MRVVIVMVLVMLAFTAHAALLMNGGGAGSVGSHNCLQSSPGNCLQSTAGSGLQSSP